ncbi:MAG: ribosome-associated heat shock protein Hsp15 [Flavobacteriales bacterium]|jgi:ribosome-associated heat shock protein Hsp15
MIAELNKTRIDKWLWSIRAYKTRTLAGKSCDSGKVKVNGNKVKSSFQVVVGMEVQFVRVRQKYLYRAEKIIEKRVGAPEAQLCYTDITPAEMIEENKRLQGIGVKGIIPRAKGLGRPTKKERRDLDEFQ